VLSMLAAALACTNVLGQNNLCDQPGEAPDVVVGGLPNAQRYGTNGTITAFAIGTESCNTGTCWANWISGAPGLHPVINQALFRLQDGRFEMIGQSWLKHSFATFDDPLCFNDCIPAGGQHLGVHCSDPYHSGLNGQQSILGPKYQVNPADGSHDHPYDFQGQTGNFMYKRLQVRNDDIDPALNPGALYFMEGQYVTEDDAAAGNNLNNNSYRRIHNTGTAPNLDLDFIGGTDAEGLPNGTVRETPAILAWRQHEAGVQVTPTLPVMGASKASNLGGGLWHYEYAFQNLIEDRGIGSVTVPLPHGATISNIGFHDVDYHSGEKQGGTDWTVNLDQGAGENSIRWSVVLMPDPAETNALRWGTLYNVRFDADVAPNPKSTLVLGLFEGGGNINVRLDGPNRCGDTFCESGETETNCAADCAAGGGGSGAVPDGNTTPGVQLLLGKESSGNLTLDWDDSCVLDDDDYEIYEGALGAFTTHAPKVCTTMGNTFGSITPEPGDRYYLVVPHGGTTEGSYGRDSGDQPRPPSTAPCRPQAIEGCP